MIATIGRTFRQGVEEVGRTSGFVADSAGASRDVRIQFRFDPPAPSGGMAHMVGSSNLRRLEFGVGQGDWHSTEWLDDAVRVDFDVKLRASR